MSIPVIANSLIQSQNNALILNQVPLTQTIMSNVNANGIPFASALAQATIPMEQGDIKTGVVLETAGANVVGVQNVPMQTASPIKSNQVITISQENASQVLTKTRLNDLVRETDPSLFLDEEVEETLLSYVDSFVDKVINGSAILAKHRHSNTLEVKDVQQFVNRTYGIWTPGFGTDELRPYKRNLPIDAHKQRLALIRKALKKY